MKELVIRIELNKGTSDADGEELAENILDGLREYDPEETDAGDNRACIYDFTYEIEDMP